MCVCVCRYRESVCLQRERDSGSVCRELESVCSEREIKRDRERICMGITIELRVCVSIEREKSMYKESMCVERKKDRECREIERDCV